MEVCALQPGLVLNLLQKSQTSLRVSSTLDLAVYDIYKLLSYKGNKKKKMLIYKKFVYPDGIYESKAAYKWNVSTCQLDSSKGTQNIPFLKESNIRQFVVFFLNQCNLPYDIQQKSLILFDLPNIVLNSLCIPNTEKTMLDNIAKSVPFPVVYQFPIDVYRVDMYIPGYNIAIECDEFAHCGYNRDAEKNRTDIINSKLSCNWVRFDPFEEHFSIFEVIRRVVSLIVEATPLPIMPGRAGDDERDLLGILAGGSAGEPPVVEILMDTSAHSPQSNPEHTAE